MQIHADRAERVVIDTATIPWVDSPTPGVQRRMLERDGGEVARATSIVRYAAGSVFPEHRHELGEETGVRPYLAVDQDGRLWWVGGNYRVLDDGIVD